MKALLPLLFLALPLAADHHKANELTAAEKKAGWTLLFDGKTMEHFRNYKKEGIEDAWVVEDGAFTLTKKGGGDVITKKQYKAFEFTVAALGMSASDPLEVEDVETGDRREDLR